MSAVRRLRFPFARHALSDAAEALRHRADSAPKQPSAPSTGFSQSFSELVGRTIRIANIDMDRDPWWLYFRRRR